MRRSSADVFLRRTPSQALSGKKKPSRIAKKLRGRNDLVGIPYFTVRENKQAPPTAILRFTQPTKHTHNHTRRLRAYLHKNNSATMPTNAQLFPTCSDWLNTCRSAGAKSLMLCTHVGFPCVKFFDLLSATFKLKPESCRGNFAAKAPFLPSWPAKFVRVPEPFQRLHPSADALKQKCFQSWSQSLNRGCSRAASALGR